MSSKGEMTAEEFYDAVYEQAGNIKLGSFALSAQKLRSAPYCWPEVRLAAFAEGLEKLESSGLCETAIDWLTPRGINVSYFAFSAFLGEFDRLDGDSIRVLGAAIRHDKTCVPSEFCFCPDEDDTERAEKLRQAEAEMHEVYMRVSDWLFVLIGAVEFFAPR